MNLFHFKRHHIPSGIVTGGNFDATHGHELNNQQYYSVLSVELAALRKVNEWNQLGGYTYIYTLAHGPAPALVGDSSVPKPQES